jgi:hypothetical protein
MPTLKFILARLLHRERNSQWRILAERFSPKEVS